MSGNHIPESVYDNLVETINKNFHLLHRYVGLRKKVLGVEELAYVGFIHTTSKRAGYGIYRMKKQVIQCLKVSLLSGKNISFNRYKKV